MRTSPLIVMLAALGTGGCARCDAPPAVLDATVAPESTPPPAARDAAPDVTDARSDATDGAASAVRHAKKAGAAPSSGGAGGIKVEGSLTKADAERIVRGGFARLRACNPDLKGRVTFRLTVDARGRVTLGEVVTSTLDSGDHEMCMIRATRDFKFPSAAGESTVSFPMTFGSIGSIGSIGR